jgi:peptidyl-prolyl cis-trans isomerase C
VGEDALRNFYATNQERYQAKKVHVAHVLFRTNPKTSETEKQALLTKAQEVYSRAMAGEEFGKLAERHSEDQMSAKKGGDLGWLEEGAVDPVFAGTAFSLKPGELSQPFATPFGFHVVKVLEGPDVVQQPFETVKGDIRYELRERAKEAEYQRLKSLTKIEKRVGS